MIYPITRRARFTYHNVPRVIGIIDKHTGGRYGQGIVIGYVFGENGIGRSHGGQYPIKSFRLVKCQGDYEY